MNRFQEKRERRIDNLKNRADRAETLSDQAYNNAKAISDHIPLGQPILVGHHSEKRHRRDLNRIDNNMRKSISESEKAEELRRRAKAAENNKAIFSDDPEAGEKLEAKIERLEQRQLIMREANKAVRKNNLARLHELGFSPEVITEIFKPDFAGRIGFADYKLTNNSANIRRLKQRLAEVKAKAEKETTEETLRGCRIVENTEDNRTQIFFPGKPEEPVRKKLKANGFRFSWENECWQRHLSPGASWWARKIVEEFYPE